jgi:hypothetical protein
MKKSTHKTEYNVRYSGLDTIIENCYRDNEVYANRHARLHDDNDVDRTQYMDTLDGDHVHWAK